MVTTASVKRAVVIGGSRGFGAALARHLADAAWDVVATGRRADAELPAAVRYVRGDLAHVDGLAAVASVLEQAEPHLVVFNAASYGAIGAPPEHSDMQQVFRVNAIAPYYLLRQHLTTRLSDQFCSCVVINSDAIYHAAESSAVYAASKAALRVLTSALASVCRARPASVSTLLLGPLADDRKIDELHAIATRRGVADEEIIRTFLRRSNPSFVTDQLIDLDSCIRSVEYLAALGRAANGMQCRLDGGSAGSLV